MRSAPMRLSLARTASLAAALTCACALLSLEVRAATLRIYGTTLVGAMDVEVDGALYDVFFVSTSGVRDCADLNPDWCESPFSTEAEATAASEALLSQVLIDTAEGAFDSSPPLTGAGIIIGFPTLGCTTVYCEVLTNFGPRSTLEKSAARNEILDENDRVYTRTAGWASASTGHVSAMWTLVPEPGTAVLVALGLAVLSARRSGNDKALA